MRNGLAKPCQRTLDGFPTGGVHSVQNRSESGRTPARGGRPESESDTPVNIENELYRDNGEGVAQCHSLTHWNSPCVVHER